MGARAPVILVVDDRVRIGGCEMTVVLAVGDGGKKKCSGDKRN